MVNKKCQLSVTIFSLLSINVPVAMAAEYHIHGVVDVRASATDSLQKSYLAGGQGKFGLNDGEQFSLSQAGSELSIVWDNGLSAHAVFNAYVNGESGHNNSIGLTEGYLKYRSIPNGAGYRLQVKAGIFYPEISLENGAYAWASKDSLNSSTLNTWLGEEIRVLGSEFKVTRLGRINNNAFDLSLSGTMFVNNDPAGALLAWHGWTMSSRQTLWTEKPPITWFPARNNDLSKQSAQSDPFLELDNRVGYHLRSEWLLHDKGAISVGYYDNRAKPFVVEEGQYGWHTRFYHLGAKWRISKNISLMAQYLAGKTLMQNTNRKDIVNNAFSNGFIALSYKWSTILANNKHKSSIRLEDFSINDNDQTVGDNNSEQGQAFTLNHTYRISKHWFASAEVNVIDSDRPARAYKGDAVSLIEKQYQLALRYFF